MTGRKQAVDYIFVFLLFFYIMLFEWTIFDYNFLKPAVNALKIGIPAFLFLLVYFSNMRFQNFRPLQNYVICLIIFFGWAFLPSILSEYSSECVGQWSKFLPRCLMVFSVSAFFMKRPQAQFLLMKMLVWLGVFTFVQFVLLNMAFSMDPNIRPQFLSGNGTPLYGPFGILAGPVTVNRNSDLFRLVSYWLEPSKASGFLFPVFFLAHGLYVYTRKLSWRLMSYACLIAGFVCLSNAGYLGFAGAVLFGIFRVMRLPKIKFMHLMGLIAAVFFAFFAVFGRYYVMTHDVDSTLLRSSTGAFNQQADASFDEVSSGRLSLLHDNMTAFLANPIGVGMRIPGANKDGTGFIVSASAPSYWLVFTGLPGLLLLLLVQFQILYTNLKYSITVFELRLAQAWVAALLQQSVYGDWMSPFFLSLSVLFLTAIYHDRLLGMFKKDLEYAPAPVK